MNIRLTMSVWIRAILLGGVWGLLLCGPAPVRANPPDGTPIITHQHAVIGEGEVNYTAEVGRIAIRDVETGEPHGYIFYTAYRLSSVDARRPVMFIWNGGPGASSLSLHFHLAGPRLLQGARLTDNPDSWLAEADLVMVDPVGTGFSRPARPQYAQEFYGTAGDVASVTAFIRDWLILNDDRAAPVFLVGESWGAGRAAHVAYALEKRGITVDGMVLISGGFGLDKRYGPPILEKALGVVDMATMALYWHKTAPDLGSDPAKVRRAAEAWVRKRYAPALAHVRDLSRAERTKLVSQLSRFTGIATNLIDRNTLFITPAQFRKDLLKGEGKSLYLLDSRRTSPPEHTGMSVVLHYFRETLGYRTDLPYLGLQRLTQGFAPSGTYPKSVNERWNYATAPITPEKMKAAIAAAEASGAGPPRLGPPLPGTREALALNPRLKVLVAVGVYDPYQQCARGQETERSLPPTLRRAITFKCYTGAHAMYMGDPAMRAKLTRDVMGLVRTATAAAR